MKSIRILGIDPGSRKTGFALIEASGRKVQYLDSGVLHFDKYKEFLDRLKLINDSALKLIEDHSPDHIALESLIYVKSPTALIKLAQTRGAMLGAFSQTHEKRIFEYSPNLIKSTVSGHGHATKEGMQKSIQMILGHLDFQTHDESDALAVGLCHFLQYDSKGPLKTTAKKSKGSGLKGSLKHMIGDL